MVVNGTCHSCQSFLKQPDSASAMMFAVGPSLDLSSDDLDARIRRHAAYGVFFFYHSFSQSAVFCMF